MEQKAKIIETLQELVSWKRLEVYGKKFLFKLTYHDFIEYINLSYNPTISNQVSYFNRFCENKDELLNIHKTKFQELNNILELLGIELEKFFKNKEEIEIEFEIQMFNKKFTTPFFIEVYNKFINVKDLNIPYSDKLETISYIEYLLINKLKNAN